MGKVYLIGAGPSSSDLITVRGQRLVKNCDVLIYDRLVGKEIINKVKDSCEKIYVGKEVNNHSLKQYEINDILVKKGRENKMVVRLKGGDPFVFGRGGEEAIALLNNGIDYEVIPGVTSAIAVPEMAGIPVTHRGISQDLHIVTGYSADKELVDYEHLAKLKGTIVFLMALSNIHNISTKLIANGKSKDTPVAVIQKGGTDEEKIIKTTLNNVANDIKGMESPAIFIIGDVTKFSLNGTKRKSVALVGTDEFRARLREELEKLDYIVKDRCILKVNKLKVSFEINDYKWLVFTGRNSVKIFMEYLSNNNIDIRSVNNKIAAIGKGTYQILSSYGIYADYMPDIFTSKELGKGLLNVAGDESKLIFRGEEGSNEMYNYITNYKEVKLYNTQETELSKCNEDYIIFGSGLGVKAYLSRYNISSNTKIIAIGCITKNALNDKGYLDIIIPDECSVESIVDLIKLF